MDPGHNFLERAGAEPGDSHQPDIRVGDGLGLWTSLCQSFYGQHTQIFRPSAIDRGDHAYGRYSDISGDDNYDGGVCLSGLDRIARHEADGDIRLSGRWLRGIYCFFLFTGGAVQNKVAIAAAANAAEQSNRTYPGSIKTQSFSGGGFSGYCSRFCLLHTQA
ncbi:hypothetical protein ES703_30446 [subsurface metagenome]